MWFWSVTANKFATKHKYFILSFHVDHFKVSVFQTFEEWNIAMFDFLYLFVDVMAGIIQKTLIVKVNIVIRTATD